EESAGAKSEKKSTGQLPGRSAGEKRGWRVREESTEEKGGWKLGDEIVGGVLKKKRSAGRKSRMNERGKVRVEILRAKFGRNIS
ncbi:hypothetical protein HHI36_007824, partial [Cryptolaemus montrouzieri]